MARFRNAKSTTSEDDDVLHLEMARGLRPPRSVVLSATDPSAVLRLQGLKDLSEYPCFGLGQTCSLENSP